MKLKFLALYLFAACVSAQEISNSLENWKGAHVDDLIKSWGPPERRHTNEDGSEVFLYLSNKSTVISTPTNYADPNTGQKVQTIHSSCEIFFTVSTSRIVSGTRWQGHRLQCSRDMVPREHTRQ